MSMLRRGAKAATILCILLAASAGTASADDGHAPIGGALAGNTPFGDRFDLEGVAHALQGTWVARFGAPGSRAVWHFDGSNVRHIDAEGTESFALEVVTPCTVRFVRESDAGRASSTMEVAVGSEKRFADTSVAVDTGEAIFGCIGAIGFEYYVLDDSGCTRWEYDGLDEQWRSDAADCGMRDGAFVAGGKTLQKVGDIYIEEPGETYWLKRFDELAAAKETLP